MKTAKEACEEIKKASLQRIIDFVISQGGKTNDFNYQHMNLDIENNQDQLEALGYKVEEKYYYTEYFTGFWPWPKREIIKTKYYVVSACCGEE